MMRTLLCMAVMAVVCYAAPQKWALLVAGSNGWGNYRHQADVCHSYQVVKSHGIPDSNIVVMMYDDIANNSLNPTKGKIINKPNGPDVYGGVPHDYVKATVTPANFLKILAGEKMTGVGSGKTIMSGPEDHIFVFFSDHGATGFVAFPSAELYAKDLNNALVKMHADKKFAKLVFYLEACESGSMFRNILPKDIGVYAVTASDYDESSWGCYCDNPENLPCLGDLFSVNWLEDSDKADLTKESLADQYTIVKQKTTQSKVMEYGDYTWKTVMISEFQGDQLCPTCPVTSNEMATGLVNSRDIPMYQMQRKLALAASKSATEQQMILQQLTLMQSKRTYVDQVVNQIVDMVVPADLKQVVMTITPQTLTQLDCHQKVTKQFSKRCFSFAQNEYVMKFSRVFANMCEAGIDSYDQIDAIMDVCSQLTNKPSDVQ